MAIHRRCAICQKSSSATLQKIIGIGFQSPSYAVTDRGDDIAARLQGEIAGGVELFLANNPVCHTKCRNAYINKKTALQRMNKPSGSDAQDENTTPSRERSPSGPKRQSSSTGSIDNKTKCFIYGRERTSKGKRKLMLVSKLERQRAIREKAKELGWEDHLTALGNMLPYLVSAGHIKYVSCFPHYLVAMRNLPSYIAT